MVLFHPGPQPQRGQHSAGDRTGQWPRPRGQGSRRTGAGQAVGEAGDSTWEGGRAPSENTPWPQNPSGGGGHFTENRALPHPIHAQANSQEMRVTTAEGTSKARKVRAGSARRAHTAVVLLPLGARGRGFVCFGLVGCFFINFQEETIQNFLCICLRSKQPCDRREQHLFRVRLILVPLVSLPARGSCTGCCAAGLSVSVMCLITCPRTVTMLLQVAWVTGSRAVCTLAGVRGLLPGRKGQGGNVLRSQGHRPRRSPAAERKPGRGAARPPHSLSLPSARPPRHPRACSPGRAAQEPCSPRVSLHVTRNGHWTLRRLGELHAPSPWPAPFPRPSSKLKEGKRTEGLP